MGIDNAKTNLYWFINAIWTLAYVLDCEVVYPCYKFNNLYWEELTTGDAVSNIRCEQYCKDASANYQYSGTIVSVMNVTLQF